jgi:cellulose biosynthesis protein BcsQ
MEERRTFNFINSIKGGCGKTTFSIYLEKYMQTSGLKKGECVLIDMDLQGTAMECLFDGIEGAAEAGERKKGYINDAVREHKECCDCIRKNSISEGLDMYVIYANPDVNEKKKYRVSSQCGYTPAVHHSAFRGGLSAFLKSFETEKEYRHLIFDMPPNWDGFSDVAMDCVLNKKYSVATKEDVVNLFFVLGMDSGHLEGTVNAVEDLLQKKDNLRFDNIFIVFNDNIVRKQEKDDEILLLKRNRFIERLAGLTEEEKEHIFFLSMGENPSYASFCIRGEGLLNAKKKFNNIDALLPPTPAVRYAKFDSSTRFCTWDKQDQLRGCMIEKKI